MLSLEAYELAPHQVPMRDRLRPESRNPFKQPGKVAIKYDCRALINYNRAKRLLLIGVGKPWKDTRKKLYEGLGADAKHKMDDYLNYNCKMESKGESYPSTAHTPYLIGADGILKKNVEQQPTYHDINPHVVWFDFGGVVYCLLPMPNGSNEIHRVRVGDPSTFYVPYVRQLVLHGEVQTPIMGWHYTNDHIGINPDHTKSCPFDGMQVYWEGISHKIVGIPRLKGKYVKGMSKCQAGEAEMVMDEMKKESLAFIPLTGDVKRSIRIHCLAGK